MKRKGLTAKLDDVLAPLGFQRRRVTWNRHAVAGLVDVVDVQAAKDFSSFTVNAGVFHQACYLQCWGAPVPELIEELVCTVRARIGDLIDGNDVWWARGNPAADDEAVEHVGRYVLPFLDRMHSSDAMERFLVEARVTEKLYPPPAVYLATLKYERGDVAGACAIVRELRARVRGDWKEKIADLAARWRCD